MRTRFSLVVLSLLLLSLLASCGGSAPFEPKSNAAYGGNTAAATSAPGGYAPSEAYAEDSTLYDVAKTSMEYAAEMPVDTGRKIISNYSYRIETKEMTQVLAAIESAVASSGGYIARNDYGGRENGQYSYANLTARIPTRSAESFGKTLETVGNVLYSSGDSEDVTDAYIDTEARLTTLKVQEARLLDLLKQSGELADLLRIENELTRVRTDIERLTGSLRKYDNLVELATFDINIQNVVEYTPPAPATFTYNLNETVKNSLHVALAFAQSALFVLIYLLPYLIVAAVVLWIIFAARRRKRRKAQTAVKVAASDTDTEEKQ